MNNGLKLCVLMLSGFVLLCFDVARATSVHGHECQQCGSTMFIPRPQGLNSAALYNPYYYPCCNADLDSWLNVTLGYRYEQTWHGKRLAECLFGNDTLYFAGSEQTNREPGKAYVLADNFGLSPSFLGSISFDPRIQNHIIDFTTRFELGDWFECFDRVYVGFNASLVHSDWCLRADQTILNDAHNSDPLVLPRCLHGTVQEPALKNIFDALSGQFHFGELDKGPEQFGRFVFNKSQKKTALANIDMMIGYDVIRSEGSHCGIFLKAVAPTGNRPNPATVFAPIIGNAHHWELGAGLDAHYDLWCCDDACLTVALTGAITHLFDDQQERTFRITTTGEAACCLSQYNLLKEYFIQTDAGQTTYVDASKLERGTYFATRDINSGFSVQGDAAIQVMYRNNGWAGGFGYNVYGRSAETITNVETQCDRNNRTFGLKGKTGVCAINNTTSGLCSFGSGATATTGLQATDSNGCISTSTSGPAIVDQPSITVEDCTTWDGITPAPNTVTPVILDAKNLDFTGAPRQISHKIFGHIDYQWEHCESKPFIGLGGECEFAQNGKCNVCTASQWGVWVRGGLYF